ncbi:MAG: hypothetical protein IKR25_08090 [Muribaculaceae bacterium]|nr:hypothetical protein [Muribaculaceae bacterium]
MMKKLLSFFALATLVCGVAAAVQVDFTPGTDVGATSVTKDGVTVTMSHMDNANYYVVLALTEMTVEAEDGVITDIAFQCTDYNYGSAYFSQYAPEGYTYEQDGKSGAWSGVAEKVVLKPTSHVRITHMTIGAETTATAVTDVNANRCPVSTTYCDMAGRTSDRPFSGVNIVVNRYADGTTSTTKVLK